VKLQCTVRDEVVAATVMERRLMTGALRSKVGATEDGDGVTLVSGDSDDNEDVDGALVNMDGATD